MEKFISQIEDSIALWKLNTFQRYARLERFQLSQCEWSVTSSELSMTPKDKVRLKYHAAQLGEEAEFTLAEESLEESQLGCPQKTRGYLCYLFTLIMNVNNKSFIL